MKNKTLTLIVTCIAINMGLGQIASFLKLPIFLDTIGTILAAILLGPWIGLLTGLCTSLLKGVLFGPTAAAFAPVAMVIGFVPGMLNRYGMFRSIPLATITGVITTLCLTVVAVPIRLYLFGGVTGSGADFMVAYLSVLGQNLFGAVAWTVITANLVDKVASCLIVYTLIKQLPERIRAQFPNIGKMR